MNSFCVSIPPIVQEPQAQYELLREQRLNAEPGESRNGVPDTCQRILFADFQGFAILAEQAEPAALVGLLDQYFTAFDDIVACHGMEKLKTIGDAYMAVGGVPKSNRRHPIDACLTALEMQAAVARIKLRTEKMKLPALDLRVGIHTGPVISGVAIAVSASIRLHQQAFSTHLAGTRLRVHLDEVHILAPGIAVVFTHGGIQREGKSQGALIGHSVQTYVMSKPEGRPQIESFQNTRDRPITGPRALRPAC